MTDRKGQSTRSFWGAKKIVTFLETLVEEREAWRTDG